MNITNTFHFIFSLFQKFLIKKKNIKICSVVDNITWQILKKCKSSYVFPSKYPALSILRHKHVQKQILDNTGLRYHVLILLLDFDVLKCLGRCDSLISIDSSQRLIVSLRNFMLFQTKFSYSAYSFEPINSNNNSKQKVTQNFTWKCNFS